MAGDVTSDVFAIDASKAGAAWAQSRAIFSLVRDERHIPHVLRGAIFSLAALVSACVFGAWSDFFARDIDA